MQRASESRAAAKKKRKCSKPTTSLEYAACALLVPTPLRTGEGLQCDPGFRDNFRHPCWGPCFRPNFRARTSHTINLGSSSGLQLQCAGPHHKPWVLLGTSVTMRGSDTINLGPFITVRGSDTTNLRSSSGPPLECAGPTPRLGFTMFYNSDKRIQSMCATASSRTSDMFLVPNLQPRTNQLTL